MAGLFLWLMAAALHDPGSLPHGNRVQLLAQDQMSTSLAVMALEVHRRPELAQGPGALGGGPGGHPGGRGGDRWGCIAWGEPSPRPAACPFLCWGMCWGKLAQSLVYCSEVLRSLTNTTDTLSVSGRIRRDPRHSKAPCRLRDLIESIGQEDPGKSACCYRR
jgi:hypothetical protein